MLTLDEQQKGWVVMLLESDTRTDLSCKEIEFLDSLYGLCSSDTAIIPAPAPEVEWKTLNKLSQTVSLN